MTFDDPIWIRNAISALNQKLEKFVKLAETTVARLEPHIPSHRVSPRVSPSHTNAETANALIGTKICNVCFQGRLYEVQVTDPF